MSYRFRFAQVDKNYLDDVRNMTVSEFVEYTKKNNAGAYDECSDEIPYINIWEMFKQEEIYDMGDCPYAMDIINASTPLFTNSETQDYYSESNLYFCNEKAFLTAIDGMRKLIIKNYQNLIDNPATVALHLDEKKREWSDFTEVMELNIEDEARKEKLNETYRPYSLDRNVPDIVTSWRYEYAIFEMVRIYKAFDWEKNYLIFYGW